MTEVEIDYAPRPLQAVLHTALEQYRFAAIVCHRRFGKTVLAVNHLIKAACLEQRERPRFAYIAPTYKQGKAIAWDYLKHYSAPIPGVQANETELRIDYPNGGQVRIFGSDNPDSLRGLYFDGAVLDEYGLMPGNIFSEVLRPLLSDREGWAVFIGTPNGKNAFYDICQIAQSRPDWFYAQYRASQTGLIDPKELAQARTDMTPDEYAQEWECSWEASVKGAVYAREIQLAREEGRITQVPYDAALPVDTNWDIGTRDATAIWFTQSAMGGAVRVIDYYENEGHGLDHYAGIVNQRAYNYGQHWFPHDINQREFTTGNTRLERARQLLRPAVLVAELLAVDEGIHASRLLLNKCWFDAQKCQKGLDALSGYRYDFNTRIQDYRLPVHDWASHGADAFRTLAVRYRTPTKAFHRPNIAAKDVDISERMGWRRPVQPVSGQGRGGYS